MAVDMFLKIENIKGESTDLGHKGEIEILSFSWGVSNPGSHAGGGGGGAGKVSMSDISFSHVYDKASPVLMKHCCSGQHIKEAIITVRKAGDRPVEYLKYKLSDILISGYSLGGNGNEVPTEEISMNFSKVEVSYLDSNTGKFETASCGAKQGSTGRTK